MAELIKTRSGHFVFLCSFEERNIPSGAGFTWHPEQKVWFTKNQKVAARLSKHAKGDDLKKELVSFLPAPDSPFTGPLQIPEGLSLLPYQEEDVRWILGRLAAGKNAYEGLPPGGGKTIIAAVVAATLKNTRMVYVCPPHLVRNTQAEFQKWAPELNTRRYDAYLLGTDAHVLIVPDSMISKKACRKMVLDFLHPAQGEILFFVDEAHRFKNPKSSRTSALLGLEREEKSAISGLIHKEERVVYLSGTPNPNGRPMELFPILNHSAPETIDHMGFFKFGLKYCAAFQNNFGWNFSGASNVSELASRIKPFLRIRDKSVLNLPPKIEETVILAEDLPPVIVEMERHILAKFNANDLTRNMLGAIQGMQRAIDTGEKYAELFEDALHLMTYRRLLGEAKVPLAVEFIKNVLEDDHSPILIFAQHVAVIKKLQETLRHFEPIVITGETPMARRHDLVKEFQENSARRVFIGNIQAAGTGITLTRAERVIMVEFDWVPGINEQASDRAHRIGTKNSVLVQYLAFPNSIDVSVLEENLRKRKIISQLAG